MTDPSTVTSLWASVSGWYTPTTLFLFLNLVIGTIAVTSRFTSNKKPQQQHHDQYQLGPHDSPGELARAPSIIDRVKSINFSLYKFPSQEQEQEQPTEPAYYTSQVEPDRPQLARARSLPDRFKSINFSHYKFPSYEEEQQTEQEVQEPQFFHQPTEPAYGTTPVESERSQLARAPSLVERVKSIKFSYVYRSQQQTYPETKTEATDKTETEANPSHKPKRIKSETKKSKTRVQESMKKTVSEKAITVEKENEEEEEIERRRPQTARLERTATVGDGDHAVDAKADDFINKFKNQLRLQRLDSLLLYKERLQGK